MNKETLEAKLKDSQDLLNAVFESLKRCDAERNRLTQRGVELTGAINVLSEILKPAPEVK